MVERRPVLGRPPDPERRDRRKAELEEAALALFLEHGLEGVTIEQIAARAGQAKGGFYRHFPHRDALLEATYGPLEKQLREVFGELRRALLDPARPARPAYEVFGARLAEVLLADAAAARLYLQERRGPAVGLRRPIARIAALIEREAVRGARLAQRRGVLAPVSPEVAGRAVVGAVEELLHAWFRGGLRADVLAVTTDLTRIVLGGILAVGAASARRR